MNTLLIAGFGDIARRALPQLRAHFEVTALVRPDGLPQQARLAGAAFEPGDLDRPESLARFAGRFSHVLHCAPPPNAGTHDPRTANLLAMLATAQPLPARIVYVSTSGVYGDCAGAWVDESRAVNPQTDRARRRVDAEQRIAAFCSAHGVGHAILRAPGVYAAERLPLSRLRAGTPVLRSADDVYTNHIHADDLAAIAVQALVVADANGVYNACDDTALAMGDWFDLLADLARLPRPRRIARTEAAALIPAPLLSFMSESRRLVNRRLKDELGMRLRYPTVFAGLPARIDPNGPAG
jgi:nucleoside-diphosphate-sugar epimerase